jgi:hypothetical protein
MGKQPTLFDEENPEALALRKKVRIKSQGLKYMPYGSFNQEYVQQRKSGVFDEDDQPAEKNDGYECQQAQCPHCE